MIRISKMVGIVAFGAFAALSFVGGNVEARRLPAAYSGVPEQFTETNCWHQNGPQLQLAAACQTGATHFFQIPLPIDTATTISPARYHGGTNCSGGLCLAFGTLCDRGTTYNADGTFFTAQATNCTIPNGFVGGSPIAIPTNGTATLDTWQSGTGNMTVFLSDVVYTP